MTVNYTLLQEIYIGAAQEPSSGSGDSGEDVGWWDYSDHQLRVLSAVYYVTPPFSLLGSILVVCVASRSSTLLNRQRNSQQIAMKPSALRILFGFALLDVLHTTGYLVLGPWAVPRGTPWVPHASGNQTTCNIKGFFQNLLVGLWIYAAGLALYHTLQVRTRWNDSTLGNIEKGIHVVAWTVPLVTGAIYLPLGYFNPTPGVPGLCWISAYPADCDDYEQVDCIRGKNWRIPSLLGALMSFLALVIIFVCMILLLLRVRHTERRIARFTRSYSVNSQASNLELTKATGIQAMLYIGSFLLSNFVLYLKWTIEEESATTDFVLNILFFLFLPLHGFFHACIFLTKNHQLFFAQGGALASVRSGVRRISTSLRLSSLSAELVVRSNGDASSKFQYEQQQHQGKDAAANNQAEVFDIEPLSPEIGVETNQETRNDDVVD